MGYIMNLRKYVGHEPIIGLGATTLVFNNKNELLLNLRNDTNTWRSEERRVGKEC